MDREKQVTPADVTTAALDQSGGCPACLAGEEQQHGGWWGTVGWVQLLTGAMPRQRGSAARHHAPSTHRPQHPPPPAPTGPPSIFFLLFSSPADPVAVEALDIFLSIVGAEAAHMALRSLATGGIYICGGIFPRVRHHLCCCIGLPACLPACLPAWWGQLPAGGV